MFDGLFAWFRNLAYFMILSSVLLYVIPGKQYQKYVRFFTGILLVILLAGPVVRLFGMKNAFLSVYEGSAYQNVMEQLEDAGAYLGQIGETDLDSREEETKKEEMKREEIKVEEIRIGQ